MPARFDARKVAGVARLGPGLAARVARRDEVQDATPDGTHRDRSPAMRGIRART